MNCTMPAISVIIPTHNRKDRLLKTVDQFRRQTVPLHQFEVVVVADGCRDDTVAALRAISTAFKLRIRDLPGRGPSAARNAGVDVATGHVLAFLDDDVEIAPQWLSSHLELHADSSNRVVLGYLPLAPRATESLFYGVLRIWWERMFDPMFDFGHRFAYHNLLTGNFSISAELFHRVGGFDESLRCHEDYELGLRLIKLGARFAFAERAVGYHHDNSDLRRASKRKVDEGKADIELGWRYPELRTTQPIFNLNHHMQWPSRLLRRLAFRCPAVGDTIIRLVMAGARPVGWLNLRLLWLRVIYGVLTYWYWRGVAQQLPTLAAVQAYLDAGIVVDNASRDLTVELSAGLALAMQLVDEHRPPSATVTLNGAIIGRIADQPGSEPLRGDHLLAALRDEMSLAYAEAMLPDDHPLTASKNEHSAS